MSAPVVGAGTPASVRIVVVSRAGFEPATY